MTNSKDQTFGWTVPLSTKNIPLVLRHFLGLGEAGYENDEYPKGIHISDCMGRIIRL